MKTFTFSKWVKAVLSKEIQAETEEEARKIWEEMSDSEMDLDVYEEWDDDLEDESDNDEEEEPKHRFTNNQEDPSLR